MEIYDQNRISNDTDPTANISNSPPVDTVKSGTYDIVSTMAYLIGVPTDMIRERPQYKKFPLLELDKNARIIRNLCMVRTAIERNFKKINDAITRQYRRIENLGGDLLPASAMKTLREDGVSFVQKSSIRLTHHIIEINRLISDRINNCQNLFPDWVKWEYIRDLFLMPDGLTEMGTKVAADLYYANRSYYPYQCYINWLPYEAGNILLDDRKFMTFLYEQHNDYFADFHQTSDAGSLIKNRVYDFLDRCGRIAAFVDCENSDPFKLCAALRSLSDNDLSKLSKIILFDDVHTTAAWSVLEKYTSVPVEYMLIERIHAGKSLVDSRLIIRACQEHYQNGVDGILLVSSDSDYWSMISALQTARFLLMLEGDKCSPVLKESLEENNVPYCYLDDFYAGGGEELKTAVITAEIDRQLSEFTCNLNDLLDNVLQKTRAAMGDLERKRFLEKLAGRLEVSVDDDGNIRLELKR